MQRETKTSCKQAVSEEDIARKGARLHDSGEAHVGGELPRKSQLTGDRRSWLRGFPLGGLLDPERPLQ